MAFRPSAIALACLILTVTGCASDDAEPAVTDSAEASSPTDNAERKATAKPGADDSASAPSNTDAGSSKTIDITLENGEFSPVQRVEVEAGQPITLNIDADEAGELHVHANPEQEVSFEAGESTHRLTVGEPGLVEVESHDSGDVVLQLEVR